MKRRNFFKSMALSPFVNLDNINDSQIISIMNLGFTYNQAAKLKKQSNDLWNDIQKEVESSKSGILTY